VPGQVFLAGGGHGNNDNLGFLSLEFVHGADPGAGGPPITSGLPATPST
jgi:hypothetical protein